MKNIAKMNNAKIYSNMAYMELPKTKNSYVNIIIDVLFMHF